MTFNALQEATEIVGETEFYKFDFVEFAVYYTSARKAVTAFSQLWRPIPVRRTGLEQSQELDTQRTQFTMPVKPEFADAAAKGGINNITVTIIRGFGTDYAADYKNPYFTGTVTEINVGDTTMTVLVESVMGVLDSQIPSVIVQSNCNNKLYDPATCKLLESSFSQLVDVVAIDSLGTTITTSALLKPDLTAAPVNWFQKGPAKKVGSTIFREILEQPNTTTLKLHLPIQGLAVGDQLLILAGCDKTEATCKGKFGNFNNFIGMTEVPAQNPVTQGF